MPIVMPKYDAEIKLVADMQAGGREAFDQLYRRYAPSLLGYISRITIDSKAAEEALQKSFIEIWNTKDNFNPESERLFTWMLRITKQVTIGFIPVTRYLMSKKTQSVLKDIHIEEKNEKPAYERKKNMLQEHLMELMHFNNYSIEEAATMLQMEEDRLRTTLRNAIGKLKIMPR